MKNMMTIFAILTFSVSGMYGCCSSAQDDVLDRRAERVIGVIVRAKGQLIPNAANLELGSPMPEQYRIESPTDQLVQSLANLELGSPMPKQYRIESPTGQFKPCEENSKLGSPMPEQYRIESPTGQFKPCKENLKLGSPMPEQYENTVFEYLKDHGLSIGKIDR